MNLSPIFQIRCSPNSQTFLQALTPLSLPKTPAIHAKPETLKILILPCVKVPNTVLQVQVPDACKQYYVGDVKCHPRWVKETLEQACTSLHCTVEHIAHTWTLGFWWEVPEHSQWTTPYLPPTVSPVFDSPSPQPSPSPLQIMHAWPWAKPSVAVLEAGLHMG